MMNDISLSQDEMKDLLFYMYNVLEGGPVDQYSSSMIRSYNQMILVPQEHYFSTSGNFVEIVDVMIAYYEVYLNEFGDKILFIDDYINTQRGF